MDNGGFSGGDLGYSPGGFGGQALSFGDGILGGIFSGIGSVVGAGINSAAQGAANETNVQLSREQMAFQENMSNTAYSRAVSGMRSAGLNPALAYSQGGASTPPGQTATVQSTRPGDAVQSGIESARASIALKQDMDLKSSQIALQKAQAAATATTAQGQSLENQKTAAELPSKKKHGKYDEKLAPWDAGVRRVKELLPVWLR